MPHRLDDLGRFRRTSVRPTFGSRVGAACRDTAALRTCEGTRNMKNLRVWRDEAGATAVEYGVMVALIAIVIIVAVVALGQNLTETFDCAATAVGQMPTVDECAQ
jgi:Flp pilus assembly pilin Flp